MNPTKTAITRANFVNVARELFAKKGKDNVTMLDIANESGKGRRTLYVYFSNKDELYTAVIENELDILIKKLEEIMVLRIPPFKKLEVYLFTRFEAIKEVVYRNGSLKADFFKNIYEGIADGSFKDVSSQWTAMFMLYAFKGLEAPYMNNSVSLHINERRILIMDVLLNGLMKDVENT